MYYVFVAEDKEPSLVFSVPCLPAIIVDAFAAAVDGKTLTEKKAAILEANEAVTQAYIDLYIQPNVAAKQGGFDSRVQEAAAEDF